MTLDYKHPENLSRYQLVQDEAVLEDSRWEVQFKIQTTKIKPEAF